MAGRKKKTLNAKGRAKLENKVDPKPMGRPKIEMDWDQLEEFCKASATQEEIAKFMGCSADTLSRRIKEKHGMTFPEYHKQQSCDGIMSVRRAHFRSANGGDVRAQISILRQHGGYKDAVQVDIPEVTRIFYPDNGRDPAYVDLEDADADAKVH